MTTPLPGPDPLPFAGFLTQLRELGYPIGLHEQLELGRLLARWPGTDVVSLGDALASLYARNPEELVEIRRLFVEHCAPAREAKRGPPPRRPPPPRRWPWLVLGVGLLLLLTVGGVVLWRRGLQPVLPPAERTPPQFAGSGSGELATTQPTPRLPPPQFPPVPRVPRWNDATGALGPAAWSVLGIGLCALAAFGWSATRLIRRRRQAHARQIRDERRELRAGPRFFDWSVPAPFSGAELEDLATALARIRDPGAPRTELDVPGTIRRIAAQAGIPALLLRPRHRSAALVWLEQIGPAMQPFAGGLEALQQALRQHGVPLERWFFDGEPNLLRPIPTGADQPLATVLRHHSQDAIAIVGTLEALTLDPRALPGWVATLRSCPRVVWLHPLGDPELWSTAFRHLPLPTWPMTHWGLLQAAEMLARGDAPGPRPTRPRPPRPILQQQLARMRAVAATLPDAPLAALETLRRRVLRDVPPEVLGHLLVERGSFDGERLSWSPAEVTAAVDWLRRRQPELEVRAREVALELLQRAEPAPEHAESVAMARWRLAWALQEYQLAAARRGLPVPDEAGVSCDRAVDQLVGLSRDLLGEEVLATAAHHGLTTAVGPEQAGTGPDRAERASLLGVLRAATRSAPPGVRPPATLLRPPLQAFVLPVLLAGVLAGLAVSQGAFTPAELPHVQRAYTLTQRGTANLLDSHGTQGELPFPARAQLLWDSTPLEQGREVEVGDPSGHAVEPGHWYYLAARLPRGNLALSERLWVEPPSPEVPTPQHGRLELTVRKVPEDRRGFELTVDDRVPRILRSRSPNSEVTVPDLPPGEHRLTVSASGYASVQQSVTIRSGEPSPVTVTLVRATAQVEIRQLPRGATPAEVTVGGRRLEKVPSVVEVASGTVEVHLSGRYHEERRQLEVAAGDRRQLDLDGRPSRGLLELADGALKAVYRAQGTGRGPLIPVERWPPGNRRQVYRVEPGRTLVVFTDGTSSVVTVVAGRTVRVAAPEWGGVGSEPDQPPPIAGSGFVSTVTVVMKVSLGPLPEGAEPEEVTLDGHPIVDGAVTLPAPLGTVTCQLDGRYHRVRRAARSPTPGELRCEFEGAKPEFGILELSRIASVSYAFAKAQPKGTHKVMIRIGQSPWRTTTTRVLYQFQPGSYEIVAQGGVAGFTLSAGTFEIRAGQTLDGDPLGLVRSKRLLWVDDESDPSYAMELAFFLTKGYDIDPVRTTQQALANLASHGDKYYLGVITDMAREADGKEAGLDLLRQIHRTWPALRVVLYSKSATEYEGRFRAEGGAGATRDLSTITRLLEGYDSTLGGVKAQSQD